MNRVNCGPGSAMMTDLTALLLLVLLLVLTSPPYGIRHTAGTVAMLIPLSRPHRGRGGGKVAVTCLKPAESNAGVGDRDRSALKGRNQIG